MCRTYDGAQKSDFSAKSVDVLFFEGSVVVGNGRASAVVADGRAKGDVEV